jgi:glycosyltransferase involved in cell wall biosynthesis
MDVFALPSVREGLPQALLEALASERAVVAARIDGVLELIQDGVTGLLVPPGDPAALASAIVDLLRDRALAGRLGKAGRRLVEEQFDARKVAPDIDGLYAAILRTRGASLRR